MYVTEFSLATFRIYNRERLCTLFFVIMTMSMSVCDTVVSICFSVRRSLLRSRDRDERDRCSETSLEDSSRDALSARRDQRSFCFSLTLRCSRDEIYSEEFETHFVNLLCSSPLCHSDRALRRSSFVFFTFTDNAAFVFFLLLIITVCCAMKFDAMIASRLISTCSINVFILLTVETLSHFAFIDKDFAIFALVILDEIVVDQTIDRLDRVNFHDKSEVNLFFFDNSVKSRHSHYFKICMKLCISFRQLHNSLLLIEDVYVFDFNFMCQYCVSATL